MKKVFVDANIIIDYLLFRANPDDKIWARTIVEYCYENSGKVYISSHSFMVLYHFIRKEFDEIAVLNEKIKAVWQLFNFIAIEKQDVEFALVNYMSDFEDAVQLSCAQKIKADFLITKNADDFMVPICRLYFLTSFSILSDFCFPSLYSHHHENNYHQVHKDHRHRRRLFA